MNSLTEEIFVQIKARRSIVAIATRLRSALIEEKIPSFKIPTNLIHSVLNNLSKKLLKIKTKWFIHLALINIR